MVPCPCHKGVFRVASSRGLAGVKGSTFLSVARAFGDIGLKEPDPLVISTPDVEVRRILPGDTGMILGCDGIWDVLSNQEAVDIALEHTGRPKEAAVRCRRAPHLLDTPLSITPLSTTPLSTPPLATTPLATTALSHLQPHPMTTSL